ncbi:MAG: hypothetical protein JXR83_06040 [Deltaproteobacteria bacterium]|nr:hypothetical protein [Deltaproteobacteria bacterium]
MPVTLQPSSPPSVNASGSTAPTAAVDNAGTAGATAGRPDPGSAPASGVDPAAWNDFTGPSRPEARITGLRTPCLTSTGLVDFQWDKKGDKIPFELTVEVVGDPAKVKAELWTNANNNAAPEKYDAHAMQLMYTNGRLATYRVELPIENIGNYRATARVTVDDGQSYRWAGQAGIPDIRFRPRDEAHDALDFIEVSVGNVNFDHNTGKFGTFADLMDSGSPSSNGKFTLEWLAAQGKTAIWLQPPFENSEVNRHPADDFGSPYAVKDYYTINREFSRQAQGLTGEAARQAANAEFKAFVEKAHSLGIKVILDVALNHVGHNYDFRDLFVRYDNTGREIREVRQDDYSNVALDPGQLDVIKRRLADPNLPRYMDWIAPWMYGSRYGNPHGAQSIDEKAIAGWGQWWDAAQLNHGGHFGEEILPATPEAAAVRGWLERIMRYYAVDMSCDGFRLDHLTGLPLRFMEEAMNRVQADVDAHVPGKNLFFVGEDFHNIDNTRHFLDDMQGGWFHNFLRVRTAGDLEGIVENPYFKHNLLNLSSHDEERFINHFGDDYRAATRLGCLMGLVGGPSMSVAGDEFGERQKLQFKQYRGIPALRSIDGVKKEIETTYARVGRARRKLAALQDDNRAWLRPKVGGPDGDIVALSRWPDRGKSGEVTFVFGNLDNDQTRENAFWLDDETRGRIDPGKRYQIRDLMADDSFSGIWDPPKSGRELLDQGIFCRLRPYQIQVLKLETVD